MSHKWDAGGFECSSLRSASATGDVGIVFLGLGHWTAEKMNEKMETNKIPNQISGG